LNILSRSVDPVQIFERVPFPDNKISCATPHAIRNTHHRLAKTADWLKVERQFEQNSTERRTALAAKYYE